MLTQMKSLVTRTRSFEPFLVKGLDLEFRVYGLVGPLKPLKNIRK